MTDPEARPTTTPRPTRPLAPPEVRSLAYARRDARLARDWSEADRLKAEIESAGWRVVDRGPDFALSPALPPDVVVDGITWYGSSASVPSLLGVAAERRATVLFSAPAHTAQDAALELGAELGTDDQLAMLLARSSGGTLPATAGLEAEIVRLTGDVTPGALLAAGLRRSRGRVVILVEGSFAPSRPWIGPLLDALADPTIACAGAFGATTADLRSFSAVEAGDADVLLPGAVAFRRVDAIAAMPVDEHFVSTARTVEWWSLRLRDGDGAEPRRAVVVSGLAVDTATAATAASEDRVSRRDFYRLNDAFGRRADLLSGLS